MTVEPGVLRPGKEPDGRSSLAAHKALLHFLLKQKEIGVGHDFEHQVHAVGRHFVLAEVRAEVGDE